MRLLWVLLPMPSRMLLKMLLLPGTSPGLSGICRGFPREISKKRLPTVDPASPGVSSPEELVRKLIDIADDRGYLREDVPGSLGILASRETDDPYMLKEIMIDAWAGKHC